MTTAYTSLLGLALPVTGELSGTWGDIVNNSITSLLDSSIAGTTNVSTDTDVTLTTTTGAANTAREAILLFSGARTALRTITAPAQSKVYTVINATTGGFSVKLVGVGPTTGVTIVAGESAVCAWNGSDFIKISNTGGSASFTNVTVSGTTTLSGLTASTALALDASKNVVSVTNTGTGNNVLATSPTLVTPILGTPTSVTLTNATGLPLSTGVTGTLATTNGGTGLTSFTANGVVYASSTSALATGSALTFDGTNLTNTGNYLAGAGKGIAYSGDATRIFTPEDNVSGGLLQWSSGGILRFNSGSSNELMRLTSTGLGIGTSSPNAKLSVQGGNFAFQSTTTSGSTSVGYLSGYSDRGGSNYEIGRIDFQTGAFSDAGNILFYTKVGAGSLTERMRLDSSGNLGIGTSSPSTKLHVLAADATTADLARFQQTGQGNLLIQSQQGGINLGGANGILFSNAAGNMGWRTNATTGNAQMLLSAGGLLGIGNTSPSQILTIGSTTTANTTARMLGSSTAGSDTYQYSFGIDDVTDFAGIKLKFSERTQKGLQIFTQNGYGFPITFSASTTSTQMMLDTSGNLLVGTTSTYGGPGRINVGFNQSTNFGLTFRNENATATGVFVSFENSAGGGNGSISQTNSTTIAYNTSSDRRLKKDIAPAPQAGADIDSIQVVSHGWVSNNDTVKYGLIAQDLNTVAPQAVSAGDNGEEIERTWGVDYSKLVPMLVKEIQSLRTRLAALEAK